MFGKRKVEAVLESKAVVEKRNVPLGDNKGMLFAYSEQSGSFLSKDTMYIVTFRIGNKRKEFKVEKTVYDNLQEGKNGLLMYQGNIFEDFIVK